MRISELSERSGVAVATIKYYTREGLLPAGERVGHNQTSYGDEHIARLRLIRALLSQGGLTVQTAKHVLDEIDDARRPLIDAISTAHLTLPVPAEPPSEAALARVHDLVRARGWEVSSGNRGIALAASALDAYDAIGRGDLADGIDGYADAAAAIAEVDLGLTARAGSRERIAETTIVGTLVGDRIIAGLRRIAQEAAFRERFPLGPPSDPTDLPSPATGTGPVEPDPAT